MKLLVVIVLLAFGFTWSLQNEPRPCSQCEPRFDYDYRMLSRLIELENAQRDAQTLISKLQTQVSELRTSVNGE